jgi:predicted DNA-binding protein with PD1-like motif
VVALTGRRVAATARDGHWLVVRLDPGERFPDALLAVAAREGVPGGPLWAIGAFREAVLAYYDAGARRYVEIPVPEEVEVVACLGNLARLDSGDPFAHVHAVLSRRDGTVVGGHLRTAVVGPTLECFVHVAGAALRRMLDPESGLGRLELG